MSPRWRKVVRDLWGQKARTVLVVISIAVGVFAVGMVTGLQEILAREMRGSYRATQPPSAILYPDLFDEQLVKTVRKMPEVGLADGRRNFSLRARGPSGEWQTFLLAAIADFGDIPIAKLWSERGAWPPPVETLLIERASLAFYGVDMGDTLEVQLPDGRVRRMLISGVAYDPSNMSGSANRIGFGYATPKTFEWLGLPSGFSELRIIVADRGDDEEHIRRVVEAVRDKVERGGHAVYFTYIAPPGQHPADVIVQPVMAVLGVLGFFSLLLSGFLTFNTVAALLGQQVRQIGIMKALGGSSGAIGAMFLIMVLAFGVLALSIAIPLAILAAGWLVGGFSGSLNFNIESRSFSKGTIVLMAVMGLLVPLLSALYPVISGTRISVREALSSQGMGAGGGGQTRLDRLLERVRVFSRPVLLSLRNTFRRKGRLALTLTTLALGGTMFISVYNVRAALNARVEEAFRYYGFDVALSLDRFYRTERILREARNVPGVTAMDTRNSIPVRRMRPDGTQSSNIILTAVAADTDMLHPTLFQGRWLLPEDENAIVVDTELAREDPDVTLGSEIVLKIAGHETTWRVVGIMRADQLSIPPMPAVLVNYPYYAHLMNVVGQANELEVRTDRHDAASQAQVAAALERQLESAGLGVSSATTTAQVRVGVGMIFNFVIAFLFTMAILLALVGGLGLMGTMSLNVLERRREFGVMRAIGASSGALFQVITVEAICIALLSWLIGIVIAVPLSSVLCRQVGMAFLKTPLRPVFALSGVVIWLVIVIGISVVASALPARGATRLTVREVLAYE